MKIVVFLGNRLPRAEAQRILGAVYLPAATTGDILRALANQAAVIGILDGSFEAPIWHKEILLALSKGVRVFGACGIGALRAVEMEPFGMSGVGGIFEAVRAGAVGGDDELVAGSEHDSASLVDILDASRHAADIGIITAQDETVLINTARSILYSERTYSRLLTRAAAAGLTEAALDAFQAFLSRHKPLTSRDAAATLSKIRELAVTFAAPIQPRFEFERTAALDRLSSYVAQLEADPNLELPLGLLKYPERGPHLEQVTRGGETLKVVRKKVLLRLLAVREMSRLGILLTDDQVHEMACDFRRQFGLLSEAETRAWLDFAGLSVEEFTQVMSDFAAIRVLERLYRTAIDRGVPCHIRVNAVRDFIAGRSEGRPDTIEASE
jgi:hypothetical protein